MNQGLPLFSQYLMSLILVHWDKPYTFYVTGEPDKLASQISNNKNVPITTIDSQNLYPHGKE